MYLHQCTIKNNSINMFSMVISTEQITSASWCSGAAAMVQLKLIKIE